MRTFVRTPASCGDRVPARFYDLFSCCRTDGQRDSGVIRVLIVAAYASVRAGLHTLLADEAECAVVGAVSGSDELERLLLDCPPDVVLFDDNEGDGERVLEVLSGSGTGLVMLGDQRSGYQRLAGRALAGWAYLLKEAEGSE